MDPVLCNECGTHMRVLVTGYVNAHLIDNSIELEIDDDIEWKPFNEFPSFICPNCDNNIDFDDLMKSKLTATEFLQELEYSAEYPNKGKNGKLNVWSNKHLRIVQYDWDAMDQNYEGYFYGNYIARDDDFHRCFSKCFKWFQEK